MRSPKPKTCSAAPSAGADRAEFNDNFAPGIDFLVLSSATSLSASRALLVVFRMDDDLVEVVAGTGTTGRRVDLHELFLLPTRLAINRVDAVRCGHRPPRVDRGCTYKGTRQNSLPV